MKLVLENTVDTYFFVHSKSITPSPDSFSWLLVNDGCWPKPSVMTALGQVPLRLKLTRQPLNPQTYFGSTLSNA